MLKNITKYHLLSAEDAWEITALVTKSDLFALIWNKIEISRKDKIGVDMIAFLRASKATCCLVLHIQVLLLVRSNREHAIAKKLWINWKWDSFSIRLLSVLLTVLVSGCYNTNHTHVLRNIGDFLNHLVIVRATEEKSMKLHRVLYFQELYYSS